MSLVGTIKQYLDGNTYCVANVYDDTTAEYNIVIRHNNTKCYIPLTTDKSNTSTPCLAVSHGSTNYYAVK